MPKGKGYGKKKLPAWVKQKAGSVVTGKSAKKGKSLLEKEGSKGTVSKPAPKPKKKKVVKKAVNEAAAKKLLRGILGVSK